MLGTRRFTTFVMLPVTVFVLILSGIISPVSFSHKLVFQAQAFAQQADDEDIEEDPFATRLQRAHDPFESFNRKAFKFNDRFYFWVAKPAATLYKTILPPGIRVGVRNMFNNVRAPIRIINNLLQGKMKACGIELARLAINSTLGAAGFFDPASREFHLQPHSEDFGQTLGVWGAKPGVYFVWPFIGPSTIRDSAGIAVDLFFDPIFFVPTDFFFSVAIVTGQQLNNLSLRLGEYESFKASALDPYIAMRNAYLQYRQEQISE